MCGGACSQGMHTTGQRFSAAVQLRLCVLGFAGFLAQVLLSPSATAAAARRLRSACALRPSRARAVLLAFVHKRSAPTGNQAISRPVLYACGAAPRCLAVSFSAPAGLAGWPEARGPNICCCLQASLLFAVVLSSASNMGHSGFASYACSGFRPAVSAFELSPLVFRVASTEGGRVVLPSLTQSDAPLAAWPEVRGMSHAAAR